MSNQTMKMFEATEDLADQENCDSCVWVRENKKFWPAHSYVVKEELMWGEAP